MKTLKIFLTVVVTVVIIIVGFLWWMGFFGKINVVEAKMGGYVVAGYDFVGEYSQVGPSMNKADSILKSIGVKCDRGFGIYYDNPQVTARDKCRSFVGSVIEPKDSAKLNEIAAHGLRVDSVSLKKSLVIEFPIKNNLSYMLGPIKAYPILSEEIKTKNYTPLLSMELYDMTAKVTYFIMQVE